MSVTGKAALNLVLGTSSIGDSSIDPMAHFDTPSEVNSFLEAFTKRGYHQIDTSRMYSPHAAGTSEPRLGAVAPAERLIIDTKVMSWFPGAHSKQQVLEEIDISLAALKVKQINIEYLHVPDRETPFDEACEAMDQAHKEGKIKHWGLSNYTAEEVQTFIDSCEEKGFVKPSVYQGQYNPIVRGSEKELFAVLRKNAMSFYAFSPAAAGFFAGNYKNARAGGRYDKSLVAGDRYARIYVKPSVIAAVDKALKVASEHGIGGHAAALRWTTHHSILNKEFGDSIIVGASSVKQLESNLDVIEQGPLPDGVAAAFEAIYKEIDDDIPYHL